jgi:hypothetical protein
VLGAALLLVAGTTTPAAASASISRTTAHAAASTSPAVSGRRGLPAKSGKNGKNHFKGMPKVGHLPPAKSQKHVPKREIAPPVPPGPTIATGTSSRSPRDKLSANASATSTGASKTAPGSATLTGTSIGALEELDQFDGAGYDGPTPPDNGFGVGPGAILEMVNSTGHVFARTPDHTETKSFNLSDFFGAPIHTDQIVNVGYSDPRVLYDTGSGRWFASILIFDDCTNKCATVNNSEVDIAVSASSDPTGSWNVYPVETTGNKVLLDQPKLGVSNDKAVTTYNENGFSGPYRFVTIQKSDLTSLAGPINFDLFDLDSSHYNVIPVVSLGSTATEYAASANRGGSTLTIFAFTGTPLGGDATFTTTDLSIGTVNDPPQADQLNDSRQLDTGTAGVQSAVWQNNTLWAAGNTSCTPPGDSVARSCLRFDRVSTSGTPSLVQDANLGQNDAHLFYPSVTVDSAGNLYAGHSVSSSSQYGTAGMTYFAGGTLASTNPGIDYQVGVGKYDCTFCFDTSMPPNPTLNRWGDYSGSAQDPNNPKDIWLNEEWGSSSTTNTDDWATEIARFTAAAPTVTSIAPTHEGELSSCANMVTVIGTDFQLGATVKFGSTASSAVNVTSPETLTASVPAEPHGSVDVTVTTPAGTSATSSADVFTYDPDTIAPTTSATETGTKNGAGWHDSDFTVNFSASDNACGSGVKNITLSASGAITLAPTTSSGDTASLFVGTEGVTTISYFATDNAGNVEATNTLTVRLDKTPPTITITTPTATTYSLNQPVAANYGCADSVSGVATCSGPVASGSNIDTASLGTKTFTVTSTDIAGNSSSKSVTYTVAYKICLLYAPTQPLKQNQIPIKLEICDFNNVNLSSASIKLTAVSVTPTGSIASNANPGNLFRYDTSIAPGGGYIYNLNTKSLPAGSYALNFTVSGDPVTHQAPFMLK